MIFTFAEIKLQPSGDRSKRLYLTKRYLNIDKIVEVSQHDVHTSVLHLDGENILVASPFSRIIEAINSKDNSYLTTKFDWPAWTEYVKSKGWR